MKFNSELKRKRLWVPKLNKIQSLYFNFDLIDRESFRELILNKFEFGATYSILIRVGYNSGKYGMVGSQIGIKLDKNNYLSIVDNLYDGLTGRLNDFMDVYRVEHVDSVQLLFVIVDTLPKLKLKNVNNIKLPSKLLNIREIKSKYNSNLLPLTVNTDYYGKLIIGEERNKYIDIIKNYYNLMFEDNEFNFDSMHIYNNYIILSTSLENNVIFREVFNIKLGTLEGKFTDTIINSITFTRKYKDTTLTISDNKVTKVTHEDKILPIIKKAKSNRKIDNAISSNPFIGTFDLEAFTDTDGFAKVYALGFCVLNQKPITFYLNQNEDKDLIVECLNAMLVSKYNNYIFYIHNINYDGVFILNKLKMYNLKQGEESFKINAFYKDNNILKLEVSKGKNKIIFVDSSNILKGKLRDLCKSFDLHITKGHFPYDFVKRNTLNYIGVTPSYDYWTDISTEEHEKLIKEKWSLKDECLFYLNKDLESLLQIMSLFNKYVFKKFGVQITDSLTISRLSLNIFLKDFVKDSAIPLIKDNMYDDIKKAYFGGVTEVYKPYGENLNYYDVNSLYPFVALNPMCGNKYTYLKAVDQQLDLDDLFGFFYCKIEAPNNYLGLLPVRNKIGLLMPTGKWSGWYFSEELKFAKKNGYKITVLEGYNFNKIYNVFNEYITTLYNVKATTTNSVEKSVMKSLLNNLLGRFGLNIYKPTTELVSSKQLDLLISTRHVNSFNKITDDDYLISYYPEISKEICEMHGVDFIKALSENETRNNNDFSDVSLVISAAITSYARIYMGQIKLDILNKKGNIYYTDTDSIVTDIKLDDSLVGTELGQFKLEYKVKKGYFISSKTYCLVLIDHKRPFVCKSKGLDNKQLKVQDFEKLYNGINLEMTKLSAIRNYEEGSVILKPSPIKLNYDAYKKRVKVFDTNNKWIDTRPIVINDQDIVEDSPIVVTRKKTPPNILYSCLKSVVLMIISVLMVSLLGSNLETFNIEYSKPYSNNLSLNFKGYNFKSLSVKYQDKLDTKYITYFRTNQNKVESIYNDIIQELISNNIRHNHKFTSMSNLINHSKNYLLAKLNKGDIILSPKEFEHIINLICQLKETNYKLFSVMCDEPPSYNIVSKTYIKNYEKWVIDPNSNNHPGNVIIKHPLSVMEELESFNNDCEIFLKEYNKINSNIQKELEQKYSPDLHNQSRFIEFKKTK